MCVYVCEWVCVCVCVYTYIHIYIYIHIHTYMCDAILPHYMYQNG